MNCVHIYWSLTVIYLKTPLTLFAIYFAKKKLDSVKMHRFDFRSLLYRDGSWKLNKNGNFGRKITGQSHKTLRHNHI